MGDDSMKRLLACLILCTTLFSLLSGCSFGHKTDDPRGSEAPQSGNESTILTDSTGRDSRPLLYDSTSEKDKTEFPSEEPLFRYDKYRISADAREYLTDREYALYCSMVDSILAYDGTVSGFSSYDEYTKVRSVLFSEFLPVRCMIQSYLTSDEPFYYENGTAIFRFVGDEESCAKSYRALENIMNEALSLIKAEDSDWERIAKLYLYVSEHMVYGNPYEIYGKYYDLYNAIVYQIGACADYAYYLNMLAEQIGFETVIGRSLGKDGFEEADHAWSIIRIEGEWYHFDACWQASMPTCEGMDYFAFSTLVRYDSLANNSPWGIRGEVELFRQAEYGNHREELPYCESDMSANERSKLYHSVFDEYRRILANEIPEDMIEEYVEGIIAETEDALNSGVEVWIRFSIINNVMNSAVADLILNYSPQDLSDYPELAYGADRCTLRSITLKHADLSDPKFMLCAIIREKIVSDRSVELVIGT